MAQQSPLPARIETLHHHVQKPYQYLGLPQRLGPMILLSTKQSTLLRNFCDYWPKLVDGNLRVPIRYHRLLSVLLKTFTHLTVQDFPNVGGSL